MVDYALNAFGTCILSTRERKRSAGPAKDKGKKYWPGEGEGTRSPAKLYKSQAYLHTGQRSSTLKATGTHWQLCRRKTNTLAMKGELCSSPSSSLAGMSLGAWQ